ncbi:hypothetical protein SAMN05216480_11320 [Pustulibacterium marinum]|uniref:Lysylphosphatidylglycerol synthase TM region n=1 Tax=Pustulibacterium marinum TaxID=1224947 RepID=A0A1I7I5Z9_9FLAO|nr:hypothetical protein [Pustulibacterium marinum]SFU68321.1 hypothetical protein SAMN05216480_11320 [Pustulibacterium marinum]
MQHHKTKHYLFVLLKVAIVVIAFFVIYTRLAQDDFSFHDFIRVLKLYDVLSFTPLCCFLLFSIANWGIEFLKWQSFVASVRKINFKESIQQSLGAQTLAFITPNRIGEYGAKALFYPKTKRKSIFEMTFFHNAHQLLATVIFGIVGLVLLQKWLWLSIILGVISIGICIVLMLKKQAIKGYTLQELWKHYVQIPPKNRNLNFLFSILRYLIFAHQFYFVLQFFQVEITYLNTMSCIASMYILASFVPAISIFDVVIKAGVAVVLFGAFGVNDWIVLTTSTLLFLGNMAIPALFGSYVVWNFNTKTEVVC